MSAKENWDAIDRVFIEEVGTKLDSGLDVLQLLEVADRMACVGAMLRSKDAAHSQMGRGGRCRNRKRSTVLMALFTRALFLRLPEKAQVLEVYNVRVG
ncbi:hypothetical protein AAVH_20222 [Aphelenchoides avenae]|nr:hypothetical protein AAVH_20222 [Aphelenchus avenae]